jgi:uncharacterized membrane protein
MRFAYSLPWWLLATGALAILIFATAAYRHARPLLPPGRWGLLVALRVVVLVLVAVILLRPVRLDPAPAATGRTVAVVIDDSRSMRLRGERAATRLEEARQLVDGRLRPALEESFDVRLFAFGSELREVSDMSMLDGTGMASDLPGVLARLADRAATGEIAAAVIVSDGASSTPIDAAHLTDALPVFTVGVGEAGVVTDREVRDVSVSDVSVVDSLADVTAAIVSHAAGRETVDVRLLENGRPIEVRQVVLPGRSQQVRERFRVAPSRTTATQYTVEVAEGPGELTPDNNRGSVFVPVPGRPHAVLLIQGGPGFEHAFLARKLLNDPGLDVDAVTTKGRNAEDAPTYYVQGAASRTPKLLDGFPRDLAALFAYDVVVLGNVEADSLTAAQLSALRAFVERRGGGLAVIGARSFGERGVIASELGQILPVEARGGGAFNAAAGATGRDGTRIELTSSGQAHPVMQFSADAANTREQWQSLPSLAAATAVGPARPGAEVLATVAGPAGDPEPLVVVQRIGRGRALAFTGEGAWRWRMGLPADNRAYETFWRQAVRWLAIQAPAQVDIAPLSPVTGMSNDVIVRVATDEYQPVGDASVTIRVREPGGITRALVAVPDGRDAGVYRASFLPTSAGVHTLEAEALREGRVLSRTEVTVLAGAFDPELVDPRRNDEVLGRVAAASGGALVTPDDLPALAERIRAAVVAPAARTVQRDLWHNGWTFLMLVSLLGVEWGLRRRWGLR